jgi:hypothetical protein
MSEQNVLRAARWLGCTFSADHSGGGAIFQNRISKLVFNPSSAAAANLTIPS